MALNKVKIVDERKVIEHGFNMKCSKGEVLYIEIELANYPNLESLVRIYFSRSDKVGGRVLWCMKIIFGLANMDDKDLKISAESCGHYHDLIFVYTVSEARLIAVNRLIIVKRNPDDTWPV